MTEIGCELRDRLIRFPEDRTGWARHLGELLEKGGQAVIDQSIAIFQDRLVATESENKLLTRLLDRGHLLPVLQSV